MGVEEGTSNGGGAECGEAVPCLKSESLTNGFGIGLMHDSGDRSSPVSEGFRTYKRRRHARSSSESKLPEYGRGSVEAASQLADKKNWRNVVLEHMYQSLNDDEGGIQGCIRDALVFHPEIDRTVMDSDAYDVERNKCSSQIEQMPNGTQHSDKAHAGVIFNGPSIESKCRTVTEMCQHVFFNIIISEKFTLLCKLLVENFQGVKGESLLPLSIINSRMKEGVYERSPMLFSNDIQQVWRNLQGIGNEMISLAKSLSDVSRTSYSEQAGCSVPCTVEEEKDEFCTRESDSHAKPEHPAAEGVYRICTCKQCGQKADGRHCLVCDSCEEMYHVSCIEPAVKEIPPKSWYCANCTSSGIGSPHDNCVVCEKLNAARTIINHGGDEISPTNEETFNEFEENSNCSMDDDGLQLSSEGRKNSCICRICGGDVENGEKSRICYHSLCGHKYYHVRCLTTKQLKSYGPHWYCPSCLCRACLTDENDGLIVLCDGCDDAYHIYCMTPPRTTIPRGKWFCRKCSFGIKRIRRAKVKYEKLENKQEQKGGEGERAYENFGSELSEKDKEESGKGRGGMDMLLNAVNYEEKMGANQMKD